MREYVRVPILVPTGVLLCAYKLGFGLVQNVLEKFKIPSVWDH
jgi:superfamily I DNA and RNA helicase